MTLPVSLDVPGRHEAEQVTHALVLNGGIAKRQAWVDLVDVVPAVLPPLNVARSLKVGEDPIRGSLGDLCCGRELGNGGGRVPSYGQKDLRVIRDERPRPQRTQITELFLRHSCTSKGSSGRRCCLP